jgi:hypothetical protein
VPKGIWRRGDSMCSPYALMMGQRQGSSPHRFCTAIWMSWSCKAHGSNQRRTRGGSIHSAPTQPAVASSRRKAFVHRGRCSPQVRSWSLASDSHLRSLTER